MKTLLLTTAAAVTLAITAPAARAEHNHHDYEGQDAVAFGYGSNWGVRPAGYGYGNSLGYGGNPNYGTGLGYGQFTPGVTPLNSGWSVGSFNPGWSGNYYGGGSTGYGCQRPSVPSFGNGGFTGRGWAPPPSILPGGCYSNGQNVVCPQSNRYRLHQSYGLTGYGLR